MKSRLAVRPEIAHRRYHERKQRRQQLLQVIADEEIFLPRFADDGRRIDCVTAMSDRVAMKHRIIVTQRVITVVIAEWSFRATLMRCGRADQSKLGLGCESMWTVERISR